MATHRSNHRLAANGRNNLLVLVEPLEGRTLFANAPYLVFATLDGRMGEINYTPDGPPTPALGQAYNVRPMQNSSSSSLSVADVARDASGKLRLFSNATVDENTGDVSGGSGDASDAGIAIRSDTNATYRTVRGDDGRFKLYRFDLSTPAAVGVIASATFTPTNINAIAFVPASVFGATGDPVLLGLGGTAGRADTLFRINVNSGAASDPVPLSRALGSNAGMTCDLATGACFVADGGESGTDNLYQLNPVSGDLDVIGKMNLAGGVSGLAFGTTVETPEGELPVANKAASEKLSTLPRLFANGTNGYTIDFSGDTESFVLAKNTYYDLFVEPLGVPTYFRPDLKITDSTGASVAQDTAGEGGQTVHLRFRTPAAGEYRAVVSDADASGAISRYRLQVTRDAVVDSDIRGELRNDTSSVADDLDPTTIDLGDGGKSSTVAALGRVAPGSQDEDWYRFSVQPGDLISVGLEDRNREPSNSNPLSPSLEIYDEKLNLVATGAYPGNPRFFQSELDTTYERLAPRVIATGDGPTFYYVKVRADPTAAIEKNYEVTVTRNAQLSVDPIGSVLASDLDFLSTVGPGPGPTARVFGATLAGGNTNEFDIHPIRLQAGQTVRLSTRRPFDALSTTGAIVLQTPDGTRIRDDGNTNQNDPIQPTITFPVTVTGEYTITVSQGDFGSGGGVYILDVTVIDYKTSVANRGVFYNNSFFDGSNSTANAFDDTAIAPDKAVLLSGITPTVANVTNYTRGINGVMLDIAGLPPGTTLTADDFEFAMSKTGTSGWANGPTPTSVSVRAGAGVDSSDRVTLIWRDFNPLDDSPIAQAVANGWLRVTMKATPHTGLTAPDVFSVGNLIADTGDSASAFTVNAADLVRTRNAIGTGAAAITSRTDFNRDGRTDAADLVLVRNHVGGSLAPLPSVDQLQFSYADFSAASGLEFFGAAQRVQNAIRMIPAQRSQNGAVRRSAVQNLAGGFTTSFQFRYDGVAVPDDNGNAGTDGIAFTIQPVGSGTPVLAGGGVSVWFDAFATAPDISSDRVGVYLNGGQIAQFDVEPLGVHYANRGPVSAQIRYDGAALDISVDGHHVGTVKVDLGAVGLVGFAAFCGHAIAEDSLLNWTYTPGAPAAPLAVVPRPMSFLKMRTDDDDLTSR